MKKLLDMSSKIKNKRKKIKDKSKWKIMDRWQLQAELYASAPLLYVTQNFEFETLN